MQTVGIASKSITIQSLTLIDAISNKSHYLVVKITGVDRTVCLITNPRILPVSKFYLSTEIYCIISIIVINLSNYKFCYIL